MKKIPNIFLVGPMGAGKSSIGKVVAEKLGCDFFDSDIEVEARSGISISWIFDVEGEEGMRKREVAAIDELTKKPNIVLATGGGSIIKAENRKRLSERGIVFYLQASIDQQVKRTKFNRGHRPLLRVDNPREKIIELMEFREPLYQECADHIITTDGSNVANVAKKIINTVKKQGL